MQTVAILLAFTVAACAAPSERDVDPGKARPRLIAEATTFKFTTRNEAIAQIVEEARRALMGPERSDLAVGWNCPYGPPRGWFLVRYIIAAQRWDLLWLAQQRAASNEGRIWAVYGLVQAGKMQHAALQELSHSVAGPVWTCAGCLSWQSSAIEAIAQLDHDSGFADAKSDDVGPRRRQ